MHSPFAEAPNSFSARKKMKVAFAFLLFGCMALLAPSSRAEDLHYFKNYFVTGDYAVEGVGLYAKGVNGMATGTISMTATDVPVGADIVAAYLYWETVETTPKPSSMNGFFDFDSTGKAYPIVGEVLGNPDTAPCWSQGGTGGPGTWLRVYRADVLRYLKVDQNGTVRDVDYPHTVTLPDSGINQPGSVPHTEGASLVVVYRQLTGTAAYKAVVIYDGANTMTKFSPGFSQTIGGFYDAAGSGARMTQIVGNGQPGFAENLTVNGSVPIGVSGTPFDGSAGPRWDNLTFAINLALGASQLTTQVTSGNNQVCLSWGAVLMSTNVVNTDGDGILDSWKKNGLHLNVGKPATSTTPSIPATFGGCSDNWEDPCENLPAMGAVLGTPSKPHKDIFVQIDWMLGNDGHIHAPKLAALRAIAAAFSAHQIYMHFDVGAFHYQLFANWFDNYMIVPGFFAKGGNVIHESSLECPNSVITNDADCEYDTKDLGYLVLGWKTGIESIKDGFSVLNIPQYFAHDRKDIFHYMLLSHALAGPIDTTKGTPGFGLPVTPPPSVSGVGDLYGGDVMVTLGLWRTDNPTPVFFKGFPPGNCVQDDLFGLLPDADLCTDQTGTSLVQAGTMMHELGHNLGLHHGGAVDTPNCMVDYPSTMNYLYQTRGLTGAAGDQSGVANGIEHIDYSSGTLLPLNENDLYGTPLLGILPYRLRYYGPATSAEISTGGNAKANCSGTFPYTGTPSVRLETQGTLGPASTIDWSNGTNIGVLGNGQFREDTDFDGTIGDSVAGGVGFVDHNDWANLNLQQIGGRPNVSGLSVDVGPADISTTDLLGQSVLGQNVLGQNVLGQNVLGQSVLGQNVLGQSVLGQNVLGQNVLGQNVLGQNVLGQNVLGEIDYDTAISTLDATGASTPLAAVPSASTGTVYNQVSLTWGPPSLGQIRTYTIYRTNLQAAVLQAVVAGTVSGTPPATAFSDPITDPNLSDIGANCPSAHACYDTNYQYYVVATDTNSNSSTPSNLVTATVDHLFVSAYTGMVMYGVTLPNYGQTAAIISGLPSGGITSSAFTCTNTSPVGTPRNVGSYTITCTGPAVGNPTTVGVTYLPGTLMITQRPLTVTAGTCTKTYDGTTNAPGGGTCATASSTVLGLWEGYTDTVSSIMEVYTNANVAGTGGSTLHVSSYTVNDSNSGGNYYPITVVDTPGTINPFTLTVTAAGVSKVYDKTLTATVTFSDNRFSVDTNTLGYSYTATFATSNVNVPPAAAIPVTVNTLSLTGASAIDYKLPGTLNPISANITPRPISVTAITSSKYYDGTTTSNQAPAITSAYNPAIESGDSANFFEAYSSQNVVAGLMLIPFGSVSDGNGGMNYSVSFSAAAGTIIPAPLTITAVTSDKTYDGKITSTGTPTTSALAGALTNGDSVSGLAETYDTPNAGTGKTMTVSAYTVNDKNNGNNYSVTTATNTSGEIDTLYKSDATLSDFTSTITNWAAFNSASNSDKTLPYTPTAAILDTGDRVGGHGDQAIVVQFAAPVSAIRVFPNMDHLQASYDGYQYTISGSNDGVHWTPLFDATSVNGSAPPFTLGTFTGAEPNVANNVLTNAGSTGLGTGGVGPGGTVGYVADFVFGQAYTYYSFGPSTEAINAGNADQELSGVAALP